MDPFWTKTERKWFRLEDSLSLSPSVADHRSWSTVGQAGVPDSQQHNNSLYRATHDFSVEDQKNCADKKKADSWLCVEPTNLTHKLSLSGTQDLAVRWTDEEGMGWSATPGTARTSCCWSCCLPMMIEMCGSCEIEKRMDWLGSESKRHHYWVCVCECVEKPRLCAKVEVDVGGAASRQGNDLVLIHIIEFGWISYLICKFRQTAGLGKH